jgi:hypothetical protein
MSEENKVVRPTDANSAEIEAMKLEAAKLELEIKRETLQALLLEKKEREYHIKDLQARLADRDMLEKQLKNDREQQGKTFAQQDATDAYRWRICTHKKGGTVTPRDQRVLTTGGNSPQYAIMKHMMINGDIWVRCLRCGKTWNPPVQSNFFFDAKGKKVAPADGKFDLAKFQTAVDEYERAVNFETNNSMSQSVQCRFSKFDVASGKMVDAAEDYRERVASSNLR